ncbi:hypothetical protein QE109_09825 [Fusibacter bizertensis]|uniref:Uncharacterized protein n=1 Tax=Fusibacter bizertensis TaxID=1488331 RepID=A0ABT6NDH7_9FIRM|nr:hypothetical protein [Fusibacter bizertensis]MDH8678445.1 hypothetical protein [Fusibacter bizertensis]
MKKKSLLFLLLVLLMTILLSGCVPGDGSYSSDDPANFLSGIWHGWIAPFSLILGIFKHNIRIYETLNSGWWYDFGFYIAIIGGGFGGLSLSRKRSKRKKEK